MTVGIGFPGMPSGEQDKCGPATNSILPRTAHEFAESNKNSTGWVSGRSGWPAIRSTATFTARASTTTRMSVPARSSHASPMPAEFSNWAPARGAARFSSRNAPASKRSSPSRARDYNVEKARLVQRLLGITNVTFVEANLETFDLKCLGRFDAIYCVGLLYHLPKPSELLAKLKEVSDVLYLNTHYCRANCVSCTVDGHEGANWREFGYRDPLSGLSNWSFWPTLKSLTKILLDAGYVPEILETDSTARGQCPHGTTILGRQEATLAKSEKDRLASKWKSCLRGYRSIMAPKSADPLRQGWPSRLPGFAARIAGFCPAVFGRSRRRKRGGDFLHCAHRLLCAPQGGLPRFARARYNSMRPAYEKISHFE